MTTKEIVKALLEHAEWAESNKNYSECLVALVKRPAKVGEWVYITDGGAKGVIGEVLEINEHGHPYVRHRDVWGLFADKDGMEQTWFSTAGYLVLDGYKG